MDLFERFKRASKNSPVENSQLKRLLEDIMRTQLGEETLVFEDPFTTYREGFYIVGASLKDKEKSSLVCKFSKDFSKVFFDTNYGEACFNITPENQKILSTFSDLIDARTKDIIRMCVKRYTQEIRYGTLKYLRNEYITLTDKHLKETTGDDLREVERNLPFSPAGFTEETMLEFLESYGGNMDNIKVIPQNG